MNTQLLITQLNNHPQNYLNPYILIPITILIAVIVIWYTWRSEREQDRLQVARYNEIDKRQSRNDNGKPNRRYYFSKALKTHLAENKK